MKNVGEVFGVRYTFFVSLHLLYLEYITIKVLFNNISLTKIFKLDWALAAL